MNQHLNRTQCDVVSLDGPPVMLQGGSRSRFMQSVYNKPDICRLNNLGISNCHPIKLSGNVEQLCVYDVWIGIKAKVNKARIRIKFK